MDPNELAGWVGGIAGGVLGTLGGLIGTYFTIKNTKGPRERAFTIRGSIVGWIVVIAFVTAVMLIPAPYKFLMFIPYGIALPLFIIYWNKTQFRIRQEESGEDVSFKGQS